MVFSPLGFEDEEAVKDRKDLLRRLATSFE